MWQAGTTTVVLVLALGWSIRGQGQECALNGPPPWNYTTAF